MRVVTKIRELVAPCTEQMHANRRHTLVVAVVALVQCGRVVSASMRRALATKTSEKHRIKRMDRLLGNRALHRERLGVYGKLAAMALGKLVQPIVLVDWSALGDDKYVLKPLGSRIRPQVRTLAYVSLLSTPACGRWRFAGMHPAMRRQRT